MNKKMAHQNFHETARKNRNRAIIFGAITLILLIKLIIIINLFNATPPNDELIETDLDGTTFYLPSENTMTFFFSQAALAFMGWCIQPFLLLSLISTILFFIKMTQAKNKLDKNSPTKTKATNNKKRAQARKSPKKP